jgi:hypothetical protein
MQPAKKFTPVAHLHRACRIGRTPAPFSFNSFPGAEGGVETTLSENLENLFLEQKFHSTPKGHEI